MHTDVQDDDLMVGLSPYLWAILIGTLWIGVFKFPNQVRKWRMRQEVTAKLEENIKEMIEKYEVFKRVFPKWEEQRQVTIKDLTNLKYKLDRICLEANCVKGLNNFAVIVASIYEIFSIFTNAPNFKIRYKELTADVIATLSTAYENFFTKRYINNIKRTLETDAKFSDEMTDFLLFSKHLDEEFQKIFNCSLQIASREKIVKNMARETKWIHFLAWVIEQLPFSNISECRSEGSIIANIQATSNRMKKIYALFQDQQLYKVCNTAVNISKEILSTCKTSNCSELANGFLSLTMKYKMENDNTDPMLSVFLNFRNICNHGSSLLQVKDVIERGESEYSAGISMLVCRLDDERRTLKKQYMQLQEHP